MSNEESLVKLVTKASSEHEKEPDYMNMVAITDILERNPDDYTKIILNGCIGRIRTDNTQVQIHVLEIMDMCLKSDSGEFFKRVLEKDYLERILMHLSRNIGVKSRLNEFLVEWGRSGLRVPSEKVENTSPMIQTQPKPKVIDKSPEKLQKDLIFVRETMQLMKEMIWSSNSSRDLQGDEFKQIYANLVEMRVRVLKIIDFMPPEDILLKLLQLNDELYDILSQHDEYAKTGKKTKNEKNIFEGNTKSKIEDLFGSLTMGPKGQDPIEKEFSEMAKRGPEKKSNQIDIDKLFDNSPTVPQSLTLPKPQSIRLSSPEPSAPKEQPEDDSDLFGSIATRNDNSNTSYDEFQEFLKKEESKKTNQFNPFE